MSAFLIDLKCMWLKSGLDDLENHRVTCIFAYDRVLRIFKVTHS